MNLVVGMADRRLWSHEETVDFINAARECNLVSESDSRRNRNEWMFRELLEKLEERGHNFTVKQLRRKWKTLKDQYLKTAGNLNASGQWVYFDSMHEILGNHPRRGFVDTDNGVFGVIPPLEAQLKDPENKMSPRFARTKNPGTLEEMISAIEKEIAPRPLPDVAAFSDDDSTASSSSSIGAGVDSSIRPPPSRNIHGPARRAVKKTQSTPNQMEKDFQNLLQLIKESDERQIQQREMELALQGRLVASMERFMEYTMKNMDSTLQAVTSMANTHKNNSQ